MGALSRTKGKAFERQVAKDIRATLNLDHVAVRRGLQSRGGGGEVPDVIVEGLPIHWECKHGDSASPESALQQAARDVETRRVRELAIAVIRPNGGPTRAWFYADDFVVFYRSSRSRSLIDLSLPCERSPGTVKVSVAWDEFLSLLAHVKLATPAPSV